MNNPSWAVHLQCPQCGAPVTLDEDDRILSCAYCRVRLLLIYPGYPCYYLDPYQDRPPAQELIYIPYWRFKGIALAGPQTGLEARSVDATFLAAKIPFLPLTLGLQARAFKLRFFSFQKKGKFIEPQLQPEDFLNSLKEDQGPFFEPEGETPFYQQALIGESFSLVYAPVFLKEGSVYDGLGDRLLGKGVSFDVKKFPVHSPEGSWQVEFVPVLCPYCGADLQGEKDTQVLLCRNCDRVWEYFQGGLKKTDFGVVEVEEKQRPYFIPFWRVKVRIGGCPRQARAFLATGVPCFGQGRADEEERYFWLPAFKISPSLFLTLSKAVSFRQPSAGAVAEKIPKGTYYPVTLPWDQAREGLTAIVTGIIRPHILSKIPQLKVEPIDHLLVFIPFHCQGSELVQEEISVGINRKALHFGRFL